jgi:crotonobetainyl-CoA:carnitine CoA-transferase CaiB-like acyl-CoA transferase
MTPPPTTPATTDAPAAPALPAPLDGLRVLDLATLFAGPLAATMLGDFGAEVVKVEHPRRPDPSRGHGRRRTASASGGNSSAATNAR